MANLIQANSDNDRPPVYFERPFLCPRPGPLKHLVSRATGGCELGLRPSCGRWTCRSCSQVLRQGWVERLHGGITLHRLREVFCWTGPARAWGRVYKQLQRAGAKFLRVVYGPKRDKCLVLCTEPPEDAEVLTPAAALERFAEALRLVPCSGGRTVNCSTGWLPAPPPKRRYRYAGEIDASGAHFSQSLQAEAGAGRLTHAPIEPGRADVWTFAADVPEDERARIRGRLFGHALPIDARPPQEQSPTVWPQVRAV